MNRFVLLAALGATLVAGCATTPKGSDATDIDDKTTITGSRIPVKEANSNVKSTSDKNTLDDMMRRGQQSNPGGGSR